MSANLVDKKVGEVYYTNDLSLFKFMEGNRDLDKTNVSRIAKSMEESGLLFVPIVVNNEMEIVDGQHRFEAAKIANVGIYYTIAEDYTIKETQAMNVARKNWSSLTHAKSYAKLGNEEYIKLLKFVDKYSFLTFTSCLDICSGSGGGTKTNEVSNGSFKFTCDWAKACRFADNVESLKDIFSEYNRSAFVRALWRVNNNTAFNMPYFIGKVKKYPNLLTPNTNQTAYIA
jgi:hypothetical protein